MGQAHATRRRPPGSFSLPSLQCRAWWGRVRLRTRQARFWEGSLFTKMGYHGRRHQVHQGDVGFTKRLSGTPCAIDKISDSLFLGQAFLFLALFS